jgi:hypothetical protein
MAAVKENVFSKINKVVELARIVLMRAESIIGIGVTRCLGVSQFLVFEYVNS